MEAVEGGVFLDDMGQLVHHGLDAGAVSVDVSALHQISVELLVARTGAQALARRPPCTVCIASIEAETSQLMGSTRDLVLQTNQQPIDVGPLIPATGRLKWTPTDQL